METVLPGAEDVCLQTRSSELRTSIRHQVGLTPLSSHEQQSPITRVTAFEIQYICRTHRRIRIRLLFLVDLGDLSAMSSCVSLGAIVMIGGKATLMLLISSTM
jgi:hypothetical protein